MFVGNLIRYFLSKFTIWHQFFLFRSWCFRVLACNFFITLLQIRNCQVWTLLRPLDVSGNSSKMARSVHRVGSAHLINWNRYNPCRRRVCFIQLEQNLFWKLDKSCTSKALKTHRMQRVWMPLQTPCVRAKHEHRLIAELYCEFPCIDCARFCICGCFQLSWWFRESSTGFEMEFCVFRTRLHIFHKM